MALILTDDFNRADANPIGAPWVAHAVLTNNFKIVSNAATPTSTIVDCISLRTDKPTGWSLDQEVWGNLTCTGTAGSHAGIGFALRAKTASSDWYRFVVDHAASSNVWITRCDTGTNTHLVSATQAWTDGDLWGFRAVGATTSTFLEVVYNGATILSTTDTSGKSAGAPGMFLSSTETAATVDNWRAYDLQDLGRYQPKINLAYVRPNR